jgi:biotin transport system substrate-specific component
MRTFSDLAFPTSVRTSAAVRDGALILAGSVLVALSSKVQLPAWPVPMTLQPLAVLLVGMALGARRGCLALVAYLLEGAAGLPVFALPGAGLAYFAGPTAGYLLAFPLAACLVGFLAERGWDRRFMTSVAALAIGQIVILSLGSLWLSLHVGLKGALVQGFLQFLPADAVKIVLAAMVLPGVWKLVGRNQPSPSQP